MATQFNFKSATPDTTFPSGGFLFGADSQSATDPSIYSSNAYLSYILGQTNSWTGAQTFTLQTIVPVGSLGTPSIAFAGSPNAGLYSANAGNVDFAANGAWIFRVSNGSGITAESGSAFNWSNTGGNPSATKDTGLSRVSAGVVGIGTGASGSVAGSLSGAGATLAGSAPQVTLGVNATTLGSIKMFGSTSGDATLAPSAAAGTATVITFPATTTTVAGLAVAQTFSAANTFTSAAPQLTLGVNATTLGSIKLFGNTSGDATLAPSAAAGTATAITLPATTTTLAGLAVAQTFTATQTITPAANTNALAVTGYSLTGSNAQSLIDLAGTWNTSGVPSAIKLTMTDTASNVASRMLDLRTGFTSFAARKPSTTTQATAIQYIGTDCDNLRVVAASGSQTMDLQINNGNYWGFNGVLKYFGGYDSGNLRWLLSSFSGANGLFLDSISSLSWSATNAGPLTSVDLYLVRDAANTLAQRNGTSVQAHNVYATYTSSTDYHRVALATAKTTLASVSGATVTATNLIPDGAIVVGVTTKVTVSLGTGGGTTGYQVGDGSDADRWGQIAGTTAGTSTDNTNWTATTVQAFTSAQSVVITADGGNFNGTGSIEVAVQYLIGQCD